MEAPSAREVSGWDSGSRMREPPARRFSATDFERHFSTWPAAAPYAMASACGPSGSARDFRR